MQVQVGESKLGRLPILKSFQRAKESWNKKPKCRLQGHLCNNLHNKPRIAQSLSFTLQKNHFNQFNVYVLNPKSAKQVCKSAKRVQKSAKWVRKSAKRWAKARSLVEHYLHHALRERFLSASTGLRTCIEMGAVARDAGPGNLFDVGLRPRDGLRLCLAELKQLSRTKPPPVQVRPHFTEFEYTMLVTETLLSIRKPVIFFFGVIRMKCEQRKSYGSKDFKSIDLKHAALATGSHGLQSTLSIAILYLSTIPPSPAPLPVPFYKFHNSYHTQISTHLTTPLA